MSQLIATINGKEVYSNKEVASIINTKIVFTDGSWCDVETGQVVNNGKGSINIGEPIQESGKRKSVIKEFQAGIVQATSLFGVNLQVEAHNGSDIQVVVEGPEFLVEDISVEKQGDTLVISGKETSNSGGMTVIQSGGGRITTRVGHISSGSVVISGSHGITINGNNIHIGGSGSSIDTTNITVKVPKKTSLEISNVDGIIGIGDTLGSLRLSLSGASNCKVGAVGKTKVRLSGAGKLEIASITGDANINMSGTTQVTVKGGEIEDLTVDISGAGSVSVNTTAQNADLDVSGVAKIFVTKVMNKPRRNISGIGSIRVGNW